MNIKRQPGPISIVFLIAIAMIIGSWVVWYCGNRSDGQRLETSGARSEIALPALTARRSVGASNSNETRATDAPILMTTLVVLEAESRQPLKGAEIYELAASQRILPRNSVAVAVTDQNGIAQIKFSSDAIFACRPDYTSVRVTNTGRPMYEILLGKGHDLSMRLEDLSGKPVENASCHISRGMLAATPIKRIEERYSKARAPLELNTVYFESTDKDGLVHFSGLSEGKYFIDFSHESYLWIPEKGSPIPPVLEVPCSQKIVRAARLFGTAVRRRQGAFFPKLKITANTVLSDPWINFKLGTLQRSMEATLGTDVLVRIIAVPDDLSRPTAEVRYMDATGKERAHELPCQPLGSLIVQSIPGILADDPPSPTVRIRLMDIDGAPIDDGSTLDLRIYRRPTDRKDAWMMPIQAPATVELPIGSYSLEPFGNVHASIFGVTEFDVVDRTSQEIAVKERIPSRRAYVDLSSSASDLLRPLESVVVVLRNVATNEQQPIECRVGGISRRCWLPVRTRFASSLSLPGIHEFSYEFDVDRGEREIIVKTGIE